MVTDEEQELIGNMMEAVGQMARLLIALAGSEDAQQEVEVVNALEKTTESVLEGVTALADAREGTPLLVLT